MKTFSQSLSKVSQKLLLNSILWASLGFIIVGGLSIGYSFIMKTYYNDILLSQAYLISSSVVSVVLVIAAIFLRMYWSFNIVNASWGMIILNWIIYLFLYTGILAPLITLINNPWIVLMALCITGIVYTITAIIGYSLMNTKFAISLSKIIMIISFVMLMLQIAFLVPMYFYYSFFETWYIIYQVVYSVIIIGMTALCFYNISNSEYFYQELDKTTKIKVSLFFALSILNMFVLLFRMILRLFLNFR